MKAFDDPLLLVDQGEAERLALGEHHDPHSLLGVHPDGAGGAVVRAFHPDAGGAELLLEGAEAVSMSPVGHGIFACHVASVSLPLDYRVRFQFSSGATWERRSPYGFGPTVGEMDLYLFAEGTHRRLYEALGARVVTHQGVSGTAFSVWAPNAKRVSLVGEFNGWDGRLMPMRSLGASGVWELFVPGVIAGALYKFEIKTQSGDLRLKTDPLARQMELPPGTASIVSESHFEWTDSAWLERRAGTDYTRRPVHIHEPTCSS